MTKATIWIAAVLYFLLGTYGTQAGVNLKNGNYYVSYTDLINGNFEVVRTYNSRATEVLTFGFGWGSDFDTFLVVNSAGAITVHENGSGAMRSYLAPEVQGKALSKVIDAILDVYNSQSIFASETEVAKFRYKLSTDANFRRRLRTKYERMKLIEPTVLEVGTRFTSASGFGSIIKTKTGYTRRTSDTFERFDRDGYLVEWRRAKDNYYVIVRDSKKNILQITDHSGAEYNFESNDNGQVVRISHKDHEVFYKYDGKALVQASDIAGNIFKYSYDDKYNMTEILYVDGRNFTIKYEEETSYVSEIKNKDDTVVLYEYGDIESNDEAVVDHYFTRVIDKVSKEDEEPSRERYYEYQIKSDDSGQQYNSKIVTEIDGYRQETQYNECKLPIRIIRGQRETEFGYDGQCRLTFKSNGYEEQWLEYDKRSGKISLIRQVDVDSRQEEATRFEYDVAGQLIAASASDGRKVSMVYNSDDQIVQLTDENNQVLHFEYGALNKPVKISIEGVGSIDVTYDSSGEIESVNSETGHKMALQVTQAMQSLLALVKPAGVDLNL
ncbi:MAG: DUF6531 domain-containing protein [Pseudomonadota bacterium]